MNLLDEIFVHTKPSLIVCKLYIIFSTRFQVHKMYSVFDPASVLAKSATQQDGKENLASICLDFDLL